MGNLSAHFDLSEFRCHGEGRTGHPVHVTRVSPELVQKLERLRAIVGKPLYIVSGFRCPWWNTRVGGAPRSQHKLGTAADIPAGYCTADQAAQAGFHGIGTKGRWAVHVDVRATPARWVY